MSRIPISILDLATSLQRSGDLAEAEMLALSQIGPLSTSEEIRHVLAPLLERGRLRQIPLDSSGPQARPEREEIGIETLRLEDPLGRIRFVLRLEQSRPIRIRIQDDRLELTHSEWETLIGQNPALVSYDKIRSPRELLHEVEAGIELRLPGSRAQFVPIEMPGTDAWPEVEWESLPLSLDEARELTFSEDPILYWPPPVSAQGARDPGDLVLAVRDDAAAWSGLFHLEISEPLERNQITQIHLAARQGQSSVSTLIRLQGVILYDFLTGIHNRSFFAEQFERETKLAQRRDQPMALLIVDIDDFKLFNTKYGYEGGDRVLATVACVLKGALRGTDTLARYGGEEFAVILAAPIPIEEAIRIAERLRAAIEEEPLPLTELDGSPINGNVTVSIGGSFYGVDGTQSHELWNVANRGVLRAKETGKNRVCFGTEPTSIGTTD